MAQQTGLGLLPDISKYNVYGDEGDTSQEINRTTEDALKALEERYAQPNWFKVAAGFAKPQLGGFLASLGSASDAMGENIEKQREIALPIAQTRAQLALMQNQLQHKKTAAELAQKWQKEHPNEVMPPELMMTIAGHDKELAERLNQGIKQNLEQRTLSQKEQEQRLQVLTKQKEIALNLAETGQITPSEYKNRISNIDSELSKLQLVGPSGVPIRQISGVTNSSNLIDKNAISDINLREQKLREKIEKSGTITPEDKKELANINAQKAKINNGSMLTPSTVESGRTSASQAKENEFLPETHPLPQVKAAMSQLEKDIETKLIETTTERAKDDEKNYQGIYNKLKIFSSATGSYGEIERAMNTIKHYYEKDPLTVQELLDAVREGGPLAAAMQQGLAFHAGSLSANISLPIKEFKTAGLNTDKRTQYDTLASAFATLANAGMAYRGVSPDKISNEDYQKYLGAYAGIGQTAKAAYRIARHSSINFQEQHDLVDLIEKEYKRTHPRSISRYTDAFNSPKVKSLHEGYRLHHEDVDNSFFGR